MHLLVINWQDWRNPLGGGAEVYLYEIFSRLIKKGHKVTLLVSRPRDFPYYENLEDFEIYRIGNRYNFNFFVPFAVKALLRHHHFDLIIDDLNKIPFFTPFFLRKKHFALMMHLFLKDIYREVGIFRGTYVYWAEHLIPFFYRKTPFVVLSESSKKDLSLLGLKEENIKIVYCGIDQNKFLYRKEKKEFGIILYMGRLKRYKSVDHLIKVVPLLLKKRSDFKIIIAGDGDARDELIKLARKERVESFIEFKFDVSEQEKIELYQRAWLLVQPSVKEGWGLTVIEANACGTPSVAARSPGLIESVQDGKTGYLYNYGDLEDLCRKIERLLSNRKEWEGFSQASIEWAKRFSWEESANEMESILTAFLSDQKR